MGLDVRSLLDRSLPPAEACKRFFASWRMDNSWQPVHLNNAVHTAIFSPPGGGKTTGLVIPFLLQSRESAVVFDPKGELFLATASARKAMGQKVVCLDPFRAATDNPDCYNPLLSIDPASPLALDDARSVANAIVLRTGQEKEPFWNDSAELHIAFTIAMAVASPSEENRNLQSSRIMFTDQQKLQDVMRIAFEEPELYGGMLARISYQLAQYTGDQLRGSVYSTANTHCAFLDTQAAYDSTVQSTFDPKELLQGKMTVFLVLPSERLRSHARLARLWISSLLRIVVRGGLNPQHKVNFVLEEAATLGKLDVLEDALSLYRGYGVKLLLIYQSMGQLESCWGKGGVQTVLSNTSQLFFGCRDKMTCEYVSAMSGKETLIVRSGGVSHSQSDRSGGKGEGASYSSSLNNNWAEIGRELFRPEEVAQAPPRMCFVLTLGVPVILTYLRRYYEPSIEQPYSPRKDFITALVFFVASAVFAIAVTISALQ